MPAGDASRWVGRQRNLSTTRSRSRTTEWLLSEVRSGSRKCEDAEDGQDGWLIELNLRVRSDGPLSWHGSLIKVCSLERFQRSLVGSHWIGLTSQKWGSQSGSREAGEAGSRRAVAGRQKEACTQVPPAQIDPSPRLNPGVVCATAGESEARPGSLSAHWRLQPRSCPG